MKQLTTSKKLAYSSGQFGWSLLNGLITTYLLFYYVPTAESGIRIYLPQKPLFGFLTALTCIFIIDRVVGACVDPWVASKSDRSTSKYGRRISYMARSIIPLSLFATLIFINPVAGESWLNALFLCMSLLLFYCFFGMYVTPYNALYTEITSNEKDRIDLATLTSVTWFLGYLVAALAPNVWMMLEQSGFEKHNAIRVTMGIFSFIAAVLLALPVLMIKESEYSNKKPVVQTETFWQSLKLAFKNRYFRTYMIADWMYWIALYFFQMTILQYVTVLLKLPESYLILFTTVLGVVSFLFYIPVNVITKKIGKKVVLLFGYMTFTLVYGLCAFLGLYPLPSLVQGMIVIIIAGVPIAIFGILPNVAIADIVEVDAYETGVNRGGIYFGTRTFIMKLGNVLSMGILSLVLFFRENGSSERSLRITTLLAIGFTCIGFFVLKMGYDDKKVQNILNKSRKSHKFSE